MDDASEFIALLSPNGDGWKPDMMNSRSGEPDYVLALMGRLRLFDVFDEVKSDWR